MNKHQGHYATRCFHQPFFVHSHEHPHLCLLRRLPRCLCCSSLASTAGVCCELSRLPLCQASWSSQMFSDEISHFFVAWAVEINHLLRNTALSKNPHISNCLRTTTVILSLSAHTPTLTARETHRLLLCSVGDTFLLVESWSEFARLVRRCCRYSSLATDAGVCYCCGYLL